MARRTGLGKGLSALLPPEVAADRGSQLKEIPISNLRPNSFQPRTHFDEEAMASLAASIQELGILQPILVRAVDQGPPDTYELIAGERRWRAARRVGLTTVPALVQVATDVSSLEQAVVENLHRQDLNPLEEAAAYQQLIEDFNLTHDQLATRVGKSRTAISNTLRLFQLPPSIQRAVSDGQLSAGHARALLGTPDRSFQERLARKAIEDGLSVRVVEEAVRARGGLPPGGSDGSVAPEPVSPAAKKSLRPPGLLELEELLAGHLSTRVKIEMGSKHGRVVVDFADIEDLERIYRTIAEGISTTT
ncbi:MAG: ParB/RepB/Spo0J family partition protein [Acidimicrobiales bacterium]